MKTVPTFSLSNRISRKVNQFVILVAAYKTLTSMYFLLPASILFWEKINSINFEWISIIYVVLFYTELTSLGIIAFINIFFPILGEFGLMSNNC